MSNFQLIKKTERPVFILAIVSTRAGGLDASVRWTISSVTLKFLFTKGSKLLMIFPHLQIHIHTFSIARLKFPRNRRSRFLFWPIPFICFSVSRMQLAVLAFTANGPLCPLWPYKVDWQKTTRRVLWSFTRQLRLLVSMTVGINWLIE